MSLKRTPLYDIHVALGGKIVPFAGFEMPVQYPTGITAEHNAVRNAAGLFDVSHMGEIWVSGPSAEAALQYLTLMKEELGNEWLEPHLFRIGASSLLTDIERQLEHYVTGNYSARDIALWHGHV